MFVLEGVGFSRVAEANLRPSFLGGTLFVDKYLFHIGLISFINIKLC